MMNLNQAQPTIRVQQTQTLSLNITQRYKQTLDFTLFVIKGEGAQNIMGGGHNTYYSPDLNSVQT